MDGKTTGQVAEELGISEPRLQVLMRSRKINVKPKIVGGKRVWSARNIAAARVALGRNRSEDAESA